MNTAFRKLRIESNENHLNSFISQLFIIFKKYKQDIENSYGKKLTENEFFEKIVFDDERPRLKTRDLHETFNNELNSILFNIERTRKNITTLKTSNFRKKKSLDIYKTVNIELDLTNKKKEEIKNLLFMLSYSINIDSSVCILDINHKKSPEISLINTLKLINNDFKLKELLKLEDEIKNNYNKYIETYSDICNIYKTVKYINFAKNKILENSSNNDITQNYIKSVKTYMSLLNKNKALKLIYDIDFYNKVKNIKSVKEMLKIDFKIKFKDILVKNILSNIINIKNKTNINSVDFYITNLFSFYHLEDIEKRIEMLKKVIKRYKKDFINNLKIENTTIDESFPARYKQLIFNQIKNKINTENISLYKFRNEFINDDVDIDNLLFNVTKFKHYKNKYKKENEKLYNIKEKSKSVNFNESILFDKRFYNIIEAENKKKNNHIKLKLPYKEENGYSRTIMLPFKYNKQIYNLINKNYKIKNTIKLYYNTKKDCITLQFILYNNQTPKMYDRQLSSNKKNDLYVSLNYEKFITFSDKNLKKYEKIDGKLKSIYKKIKNKKKYSKSWENSVKVRDELVFSMLNSIDFSKYNNVIIENYSKRYKNNNFPDMINFKKFYRWNTVYMKKLEDRCKECGTELSFINPIYKISIDCPHCGLELANENINISEEIIKNNSFVCPDCKKNFNYIDNEISDMIKLSKNGINATHSTKRYKLSSKDFKNLKENTKIFKSLIFNENEYMVKNIIKKLISKVYYDNDVLFKNSIKSIFKKRKFNQA